jgi:hypothetical protein
MTFDSGDEFVGCKEQLEFDDSSGVIEICG